MIHLTPDTPILLATQSADFRKGLDGFIALCQQSLKHDPRSGTRFVFINRAKTLIRIVCYDGSGFWLMTKRLSSGRFKHWPTSGENVSTLTAIELSQLLKGFNNDKGAFKKVA